MRLAFRLLAFFAITSAAAVPTQDDTDIRALIAQYVDARNHNDASALRELFTPDADQLVSSGEWRRGRDALLSGAMASSKKENGHSSVVLESVRLIGSDAAIADGRYETVTARNSTPRKMWSAFILERTVTGWRITAIRNMLPSAAVP